VEKVLLISTDKAAQPVNLYGSTKLCAEKLFVSGNSYAGGKTMFSCVRYGNVLGSRGSIVETLLNNPNIKKAQITDLEMTRFWITLEQAFNLVLFALENMEGGEIFVPKIPSMKLVDLFDIIVPGIEKEIIGIRPGEKLHEVLVTEQEARHSLSLEKYYVILPEFMKDGKYRKYNEIGEYLEKDFRFASHANKEWLEGESLKILINELKQIL
jgi:UDP-N-acetylglucosamine 4,6-dehydratase